MKNSFEIKRDKIKGLTLFYNEKLKALVERFYENKSSSVEENQEVLNNLSKQWKQIVYRANLLYKGLNLLQDAFEKTITHNHFIILILTKEPRLTSQFLNNQTDSLLQELSENDDQLAAFTENYLRYLELQKEKKKKTFKTAE